MGSINLSLHHIESIRIIERRCDSTNEQYFTIRVDTDTDIHDIILFVYGNKHVVPELLLKGALA